MKVLALLLSVVCVQAGAPIPEHTLSAYQNEGVKYIDGMFETANREITAAMNVFNPIKDACMKQLEAQTGACGDCVVAKCKARAKKACEPKDWEKALGKVIEFTKDSSKFVFEKVPKFIIKELPNKIIDVAKDVHRFLKDKVLGKVIDIHKKIGKGVIDAAKGLGKGVVDLGTKTVKEIGRVGEKIIDVHKSAIKEVGRFGTRVGKEIGRVFRRWGKRSLRGTQMIRLRRSAEPGCSSFKDKRPDTCEVYKSPSHCPSCSVDPMKDCAGFAAAVAKVEATEKGREWMLTKPKDNSDYIVHSISYDMQGASFVNVIARVDLFGKVMALNMGSINPWLPDQYGKVLAQKAIDVYKRG